MLQFHQLFFRLWYLFTIFFMPFNTHVLSISTKALIKLQIRFWNSESELSKLLGYTYFT